MQTMEDKREENFKNDTEVMATINTSFEISVLCDFSLLSESLFYN